MITWVGINGFGLNKAKSMRKTITVVIAATAAVGAAATAVAMTAPGATAGTATTASARTGISVRLDQPSGGALTKSVPRGGALPFRLAVTNTGTVPLSVTEFASGQGGLSSPKSATGNWVAVQPQSHLSSWNSFSPATFTLAPQAWEYVYGTIRVPADAPLGPQPAASSAPAGLKYNVAWSLGQPRQPAGARITGVVGVGVREYVTVTP